MTLLQELEKLKTKIQQIEKDNYKNQALRSSLLEQIKEEFDVDGLEQLENYIEQEKQLVTTLEEKGEKILQECEEILDA